MTARSQPLTDRNGGRETVTLDIPSQGHKRWRHKTLTVPLDMFLEAHLHLSLEYPWQDNDTGIRESVSVEPLRLNHNRRDAKGKFTKQ